VPSAAPRYDPRLLKLARELDDRQQSMAETCRRVGARADDLGITRPSYVHLRRYIRAQRELRAELSAVLEDVVVDLLASRAPKVDRSIERVRNAMLLAQLRSKA
jgi:hypothetical protein